MVDVEKLSREYIIKNYSFAYLQDDLNAKRLQNAFKAGYDKAEELYKEDLKETIELVKDYEDFVKQQRYDVFPYTIKQKIHNFLDKYISCSKNGIKKEGESCTLNNNCIYWFLVN